MKKKSPRKLFTHSLPLSSAHTLAQPHLSEEEIKQFYSACGKPHGHLYQIEITHDFSGYAPGEATSAFNERKKSIEDFFEKNINGKDLNLLFENTAGEALSPAFFEILKREEFGTDVAQVAIQETSKNRFITYSSTHNIGHGI